MGRFPDWFPPDCPPENSPDADGIVFRFTIDNRITAQDFLSHQELGLAPRSQPCRRCSLSIYRDLEYARKKLRELRDRSPDRFGASCIAEGMLKAEHGKSKQEGADKNHHEWWPYDGVQKQHRFYTVHALDV